MLYFGSFAPVRHSYVTESPYELSILQVLIGCISMQTFHFTDWISDHYFFWHALRLEEGFGHVVWYQSLMPLRQYKAFSHESDPTLLALLKLSVRNWCSTGKFSAVSRLAFSFSESYEQLFVRIKCSSRI